MGDSLVIDVVVDDDIVIQDSGPQIDVTVPEPIVAVITVDGPPGQEGPPGQPGGLVQRFTSRALSGHRAVTPLDDGTVDYADTTNPAHLRRPVWLTTGAWASDALALLVTAGPISEPSWNWLPGIPVYLGANGQLTQTITPGCAFVRVVAEVIDTTTIAYWPQSPIATP